MCIRDRSTSDVIKRAWSYLIISDTKKYCELCKNLLNSDNEYILHYNDDINTIDYDKYIKRYLFTIKNYKSYFSYDPPNDIWRPSSSPSSLQERIENALKRQLYKEESSSSLTTTTSSSLSSSNEKGENEQNLQQYTEETSVPHKKSRNMKKTKKEHPDHLLLGNTTSNTTPSIVNINTINTITPSPQTDTSSQVTIKKSKKIPLNQNIGNKLRVVLLNSLFPFFQTDSYPSLDDIVYNPIEYANDNSVISYFKNKWYAVGIIDEYNNILFSDATAIECEIKINNFSVKYTSNDPDYHKEARGVYYFTAIDEIYNKGVLCIKFKTKPNENEGSNKSYSISAEPMVFSINIDSDFSTNQQLASIKRNNENDGKVYKIINDDIRSDNNDDTDDDNCKNKEKS